MLVKYTELLTSKPCRCNIIQYQCKVTPGEPLVGHTSFSVRSGVRTQIRQMLEDNIIEVPNSNYLNPLTFALRKGKIARTCVDARRANKWPLTVSSSAPPMNESSQKFHGSRFITTTDLSSAFSQIFFRERNPESTQFLFERQVYQYTRTPYGLSLLLLMCTTWLCNQNSIWNIWIQYCKG
jgi:hypothetical protein